jgi:hypothetical protein
MLELGGGGQLAEAGLATGAALRCKRLAP